MYVELALIRSLRNTPTRVSLACQTRTQIEYIDVTAKERGLANVSVSFSTTKQIIHYLPLL